MVKCALFLEDILFAKAANLSSRFCHFFNKIRTSWVILPLLMLIDLCLVYCIINRSLSNIYTHVIVASKELSCKSSIWHMTSCLKKLPRRRCTQLKAVTTTFSSLQLLRRLNPPLDQTDNACRWGESLALDHPWVLGLLTGAGESPTR